MSLHFVNPRPHIAINALAAELSQVRSQILPAILELKKQRLIQYDAAGGSSALVKLTLLGFTATR